MFLLQNTLLFFIKLKYNIKNCIMSVKLCRNVYTIKYNTKNCLITAKSNIDYIAYIYRFKLVILKKSAIDKSLKNNNSFFVSIFKMDRCILHVYIFWDDNYSFQLFSTNFTRCSLCQHICQKNVLSNHFKNVNTKKKSFLKVDNHLQNICKFIC